MTTKSHTSTRPATHSRLAGLRDQLRERRQARLSYRTLERELAAYRTPSEINDLLAAVDRHDSADAEDIRGILTRNMADFRRSQRFAS
jgi:hypothetical protein